MKASVSTLFRVQVLRSGFSSRAESVDAQSEPAHRLRLMHLELAITNGETAIARFDPLNIPHVAELTLIRPIERYANYSFLAFKA
jgi:hypothetical protein